VYEQLSASRNRLSQQLSEKNRSIAAMEERLEQRERDLVTAMRAFSRLRAEVEALQQLMDSAAAALAYGVDRQGDLERMQTLSRRLLQLRQVLAYLGPLLLCRLLMAPCSVVFASGAGNSDHESMQAFGKELAAFDVRVPREVPVFWYGVASEVRLMGDFDGWTRGVDLCAEDFTDNVFTQFEANVLLLPVCSPFVWALLQGSAVVCKLHQVVHLQYRILTLISLPFG
jgi:hypothetical protein